MTLEIPVLILILLIVSNTISGLARTYTLVKAFNIGLELGAKGTVDFLRKEGLIKEEP